MQKVDDFLAAGGLLVMVAASSASAQIHDHLACYIHSLRGHGP